MAGYLPALRSRHAGIYGKMKKYAIFGGVALGVLALDQATKALVLREIPLGGVVGVIPGLFDLVHYRNRGAAFGFLNSPDIEWQFWLFLSATGLAATVILLLARQTDKTALLTGLGMILGGAVGNFIDRVRFRSVIDFLDFYWGVWHWPAFNVADMGICCGAFLTCVALWSRNCRQ